MNHRSAAALFAATLLANTALATAPALAGTWVITQTKRLDVTNLANATELGALPDTTPLTVRIGLKPQNKQALIDLVQAQADPTSPNFENFLTPAQFTATYAPTPAQVSSVTAYLKDAGFTNIVVEPNNMLISADGTAYMARTAFNTKLERISIGGTNAFINLLPAAVPAALGNIVNAVLGLNSVGQMKSTIALPSVPQYLVSYTPPQFQTIYGATGTQTGANASIAVMAEGNVKGVVTDLRIAEKAFGLPAVPVTIKPVGLASADVSGADEWDMDTQYSSGMAERLKMLYIYDVTSLSDSDLALEFSHWVTDDVAKAASASLGECEIFPYTDGSMAVDDMTFLEAAAQGQTFFASSGDTGSFCPIGPAGVNGVPAGAPLVNYPATSPYVVGVGGTTLLTNSDGSYDTEIAWYAGSGGVSQFEGSPAWQSSKVTVLGEGNLRGVPDIALDADPESGALVYVNGVAEGVGGTSLSSPMSMGMWARAISRNPKRGNAGPLLYSLYAGGLVNPTYPNGGFHDITVGVNGIYSATTGYDLTTGLGTIIVDQFLPALLKQ